MHVTVVLPSGNVEPDAGAHVVDLTGSSGSAALTANATCAPEGPVASAAVGAGTVSTGAVVSEKTSACATIFAS